MGDAKPNWLDAVIFKRGGQEIEKLGILVDDSDVNLKIAGTYEVIFKFDLGNNHFLTKTLKIVVSEPKEEIIMKFLSFECDVQNANRYDLVTFRIILDNPQAYEIVSVKINSFKYSEFKEESSPNKILIDLSMAEGGLLNFELTELQYKVKQETRYLRINSSITIDVFDPGDGTKENPYKIFTCEEFDQIRNELSAHYILDVYKRWCAFGLLSSHSRLHGSTSYRVPWAYDEEAVDVLRHFTKLKAKLMPYVYAVSNEASNTGIPTLRSMVLEFTEDKNTHYLDRQYLFGDALLVAPILNDQGLGEFYLPQGKWTDLQTKEEYDGNQWYQKHYNYFGLPLMVRENTILPVGAIDNDCEYDYEDNLTLEVYNLVENKEATRTVYSKDRKEAVKVSMLKQGDQIKVSLEATKSLAIRFINLKVKSGNLRFKILNVIP